MFCKYQSILFKHPKNNKQYFSKVENIEPILKDRDLFKEKFYKKQWTFIGCGKCETCILAKNRIYSKRINSQFKETKYNYLITLTFDNDKVQTLINKESKEYMINNNLSISSITTLSKIKIANIIKNWKNKFNRFYKKKINFNYFLCGEYGGNTHRAHYHIILMLDVPVPDLIKQPVKDEHFKSWIFESKQYSLYDIKIINSENASKVSSYLTKYLTKQNDTNILKIKYNNFEEQLINYFLSFDDFNNDFLVVKNIEQLNNVLIYYYFLDNPKYLITFNPQFDFKKIIHQKEFIKYSRKLGITENEYVNIDRGVFFPYYRYKIEQDNNPDFRKEKNNILMYYDAKRINNIKKYFGMQTKKPKKYTNRGDIF